MKSLKLSAIFYHVFLICFSIGMEAKVWSAPEDESLKNSTLSYNEYLLRLMVQPPRLFLRKPSSQKVESSKPLIVIISLLKKDDRANNLKDILEAMTTHDSSPLVFLTGEDPKEAMLAIERFSKTLETTKQTIGTLVFTAHGNSTLEGEMIIKVFDDLYYISEERLSQKASLPFFEVFDLLAPYYGEEFSLHLDSCLLLAPSHRFEAYYDESRKKRLTSLVHLFKAHNVKNEVKVLSYTTVSYADNYLLNDKKLQNEPYYLENLPLTGREIFAHVLHTYPEIPLISLLSHARNLSFLAYGSLLYKVFGYYHLLPHHSLSRSSFRHIPAFEEYIEGNIDGYAWLFLAQFFFSVLDDVILRARSKEAYSYIKDKISEVEAVIGTFKRNENGILSLDHMEVTNLLKGPINTIYELHPTKNPL
jgi:hypothetical protein